MEGHVRHAPHVDADRGQGRARAGAAAESLLGRRPPGDAARPVDAAAAARRALVHDGVRLHRPPARHSSVGRRAAVAARSSRGRSRISIARSWRSLRDLGLRREDLADAGRDPVADPVRRGHHPPRRTTPCGGTVLADPVGRSSEVLPARALRFVGKCSPAHFFWGGFDLAVTRFSGRRAPPREGPAFMREAYSHEVISHGFWPGSDAGSGAGVLRVRSARAAGFCEAAGTAGAAFYHRRAGEFILPYEAVRTSGIPRRRFVRSSRAPTSRPPTSPDGIARRSRRKERLPQERPGEGARERGNAMAQPNTSSGIKNVVLVHGGFVDGSGWEGVYRILRKDGPRRRHRPEPDDIAGRRRRVHPTRHRRAEWPGHPRRGTPTEAWSSPKRERSKGRGARLHRRLCPGQRRVRFLSHQGSPAGRARAADPAAAGRLPLDRAKFPASFAGDVDAETAAFMADSQAPWGVEALGGAVTEPAWKTKPSSYLVATSDRMIPPPAQRAMSKRAGRRSSKSKAATPSTCRSRRRWHRSSKRPPKARGSAASRASSGNAVNPNLTGKVALVAGGTGALGRAVSLAFLREGASVIVTYRRADEFGALKAATGAEGVRLDGHESTSRAKARCARSSTPSRPVTGVWTFS